MRSDLATIDRFSCVLSDQPQPGDRLSDALEDLHQSLRLRGIVVRDSAGRVAAAADPEGLQVRAAGPTGLQPDSWLRVSAPDIDSASEACGLRRKAAAFRLRTRGEYVGTLDLWEGDPASFDHEQYQVLTVIAWFIATELFASR